MSDDNTRDAVEPSPASAGSQEPVAWAVMRRNGTTHELHKRDPQWTEERKNTEWSAWGLKVVPLYRSPALTDQERNALERISLLLGQQGWADANTLIGLLKRLG